MDDDGNVKIGGYNKQAVLQVEDVDAYEAKMNPPLLEMDCAVELTKPLTSVVISPMVALKMNLKPMEFMDNDKGTMPT